MHDLAPDTVREVHATVQRLIDEGHDLLDVYFSLRAYADALLERMQQAAGNRATH